MRTKDRLVKALIEAGAPKSMIDRAESGQYDDFEADSATPIHDLVVAAEAAGLKEIAKRAMSGEFDGTKDEGDSWMKRKGNRVMGW